MPLIEDEAVAEEQEITAKRAYDSNHGSFGQDYDGKHPALDELGGLVDMGFADVFADIGVVEMALGDKVIVSPFG